MRRFFFYHKQQRKLERFYKPKLIHSDVSLGQKHPPRENVNLDKLTKAFVYIILHNIYIYTLHLYTRRVRHTLFIYTIIAGTTYI